VVPGLYYNCASQLDAGIDLRYVQRYKTNHKSAILGQDGFLGTMSEYEGLFDAFPRTPQLPAPPAIAKAI